MNTSSTIMATCLAVGMLFAPGAVTRGSGKDTARGAPKAKTVVLVVMDPLAKELACACAPGYGQRDYRQLSAHLAKQLGQRVVVRFSDDLAESVKELEPGEEAVIVGKNSMVEHDAQAAGFKPKALCRLTGIDGATGLTGFFIARASDPATKIEDLAGRRVLFGLPNADEKHSAALAALKAAGIPETKRIETRRECSDIALDLLDSTETPPPVGVISSCSLPLLEHCGSIKKGELKVIGRTQPVPFITVFCSADLPAAQQQNLLKALRDVAKSPRLLKALETKTGFVPIEAPAARAQGETEQQDWPDWRGVARDGHVSHLPAQLPERVNIVWKRPALNGGLAGIAVAKGRVIVAERDPADERDLFRCLDATDGHLLWLLEYPAPGKLDYGQFPRATPVVQDDRVYLLGALGHLHCVRLDDGKILWRRHLVKDLGGQLSAWGSCATPLLVDDLLIVNPGGPKASLVALEVRTGKIRWTAPGNPAAYGSFISAILGGKSQIVGYDKVSLGGWDPKSGRRLWTLTPPSSGDFNVPTPLAVEGKLLVATENNGTRLYGFGNDGTIIPAPLAEYPSLAPDTTTPVAMNGRLFGCYSGMHCLDLRDQLKLIWHQPGDALGDHASLIASADRILVVAMSGELFLYPTGGRATEPISRLRLFEDSVEVYSHPAVANNRLYIRGPNCICCVDLGTR